MNTTSKIDASAMEISLLRALFSMTKPTITLLVVATTVPSLLMASNAGIDGIMMVAALLGTGMFSGSAAICNQIFESDIDRTMQRTCSRAIPRGKVETGPAAAFAILLAVAAFGVLWYGTTPLAAVIGLLGHVYYSLFYTVFLKMRTEQNIVLGGAAGAVGPLIGWAAVSGEIAWPAWAQFFLIFLWTPPHFWALALKYKDDYANAGVPMYPVVRGVAQTRKVILLYSLTLLAPVCALFFMNGAGLLFFLTSCFLTVKFIWEAYILYRKESDQQAMRLFHYSCLYTFAVFGFLALDALSPVTLSHIL